MRVYPDQLHRQLNTLKPCYLLFGDDPWLLNNAKGQLIAAAKAQGFEERIQLEQDNSFNWQDLANEWNAMSLFASRRIIELHLPQAKPGTDGSAMLQQLLNSQNSDVMLILSGPKLAREQQSSKWFKALDKDGIFVPCTTPEAAQFQRWLEGRIQFYRLNLQNDARAMLANLYEGNLLAADQALQLLQLLAASRPVSADELAQYFEDQSRFNVFQLVDALLENRQDKAQHMLVQLKAEDTAMPIIHWALQKELTILWQLQSAAQARQPLAPIYSKLRIWDSRQPLYQSALSRLSLDQLEWMLSCCSTLELKLKRQGIEDWTGVSHLCLLFDAKAHAQLSGFGLD
ncbi:DNA polymerase III subunit delta [Shewanella avicenniae]|uniref:DNA polymerase III subunit delta n=1 Tax=Shewanella avicenniae TaxID=2814294 RepID=A0ABX7QT01_9GAMM|nr:DNA polymerase III subunit delta [Shewanella avicenniae]QSX34604.1 DNA polymerase III subunit delta [Shewanella avicenniae]